MLSEVKNVFAAAVVLLAMELSAQVVNGDFSKINSDGTPEGWKCVRSGRQQGGVTVDQKIYRSPKGALRLQTGNRAIDIIQDVKLKPNTKYRFSCWYKTSQCDPAPERDVKRWGGGCDLALRSVHPDGQTHWHFGINRKYKLQIFGHINVVRLAAPCNRINSADQPACIDILLKSIFIIDIIQFTPGVDRTIVTAVNI